MNVVVRGYGGLGNQLFQYAAGKYYARRYGAALRIAADPPRYALSHGYPRPCLLSHFSIAAPLAERSLADRILLTDKPWLKALATPLKRARRIQVFVERVEHHYCFLRDLPLEQDVKTLYLQGYFQTRLLVEEIADELRVDLTLREPPQGKNLELLAQISQSRNPVSLHIRRGDAIHPREGKVVLTNEYYSHAISIIKDRFADPVFFVFSDDIPFAKENLPRDIEMRFVEHNDDFAAHEDLRLMSTCRHHIIANSTFSWWGAWLNPRPDKVVVAPRRWFLKVENYYANLLPQDWILADVAALV